MQHELPHLLSPLTQLTPADSPTLTEPLFSQTMPCLHSDSASTGPVRSHSALRNRLRLKPTASRSTGALKQPPSSTHSPLTFAEAHMPIPTDIKFFWKMQSASSQKAFLFIAHDNPQLGKTLHSMLGTHISNCYSTSHPAPSSSSSASSSSSSKLQAMLESTDGAGQTRFLLGDIVYSGECEHVEGAQLVGMRGSLFIVLTNLSCAVCNVKSLPKTPRGEIVEVAIPFSTPPPLSPPDTALFLQSCTARVDVILDPHQSGQNNFPYFEGLRKMAPQFRSKGVGYIR